MRELSIKDQIRNASSITDLDAIMEKSKTYIYASGKTSRAWIRLANAKARELS